jgi:hypothetical protein
VTHAGLLAGTVCFLAGLLESGAEVRIVSPTNGTVFPAYATVRIEVEPEFASGERAGELGLTRIDLDGDTDLLVLVFLC